MGKLRWPFIDFYSLLVCEYYMFNVDSLCFRSFVVPPHMFKNFQWHKTLLSSTVCRWKMVLRLI